MKNNNLISKNPILRFKLGKKIIKAEDGWRLLNGRAVLRNVNNAYDIRQAGDKKLTHRYIVAGKLYGSFDGGKTYYSLESGKILNSKSNQHVLNAIGRRYKQNSKSESVGNSKVTKGVSTSVSTPVDYGLVRGVLKGWKGLRGFIDDQSFADLQSLGYSGERNARAAQLWMNDNLSKYLVPGAVATDNAWGELSSRALKMMMLNKANLDLAAIFTQNPVLFNSSNFKDELAALNVGNTPDLKLAPTKFNFNRALTRDWLRNNGIGPYSLTGAQRHAVRNVLGGKGTDLDRSLIGTNSKLLELLTKKGYFKQGGQLPSRNIVERFKQRNFR